MKDRWIFVAIVLVMFGLTVSLFSTIAFTTLRTSIVYVPEYAQVDCSLIVLPELNYTIYKTHSPLTEYESYNISYSSNHPLDFYVMDQEDFLSWLDEKTHTKYVATALSNTTIVNWKPPRTDIYYIVYSYYPVSDVEWYMTTQIGENSFPRYTTEYFTLLPSYLNVVGIGLLVCGAVLAMYHRTRT